MKISIYFFLVLLSILNSHAQTTILTIIPPANATYGVGANLDFTVNFSATVNVTGTPRIAMNIGGNLRYANYLSGSGTSSLNFRYSIVSGFGSVTGMGIASPLQLNGGTINDSSPAPAVLTFRNTFYSGIIVDAPVPGIVSINKPSTIPPIYLAGQTADFTVTFSEPMFASQNTSRLKINVGGVFQSAVLVSGSGTNTFTYRYTVAIGNFDSDGLIMLSPLEKSTSTILNANGMAPTLTFVPPDLITMTVDGRVPTVVVNTKPTNGFYTAGDSFNFTLTYSRNVYVTGNPRVPIHVGYPPLEISRYADYIGGSGTNELTFRYIIQTADEDSDGVYFNQWLNMDLGSIVDDVGNSAMFAFWGIKMPNYGYSTATVDGTPNPTISEVLVPTNADYQTGQTLDFTVVYDKPVVVGLTPRLPITIGSSTAYANYLSGSGTSTLVFRYTVQPENMDLDGITLTSPLELSGGSIQDLSMTYNANLTFTPPSTAGISINATPATISSITPPADGTYGVGLHMDFIVNYTSQAIVTGVPRIQLTVGATTLYANYFSGSGSASHIFRYTVGAGHNDTDGVTTVGPVILLNGGTIQNTLGLNVQLDFTAATYANKKVDTIAPTTSNMVVSANGIYAQNGEILFTATYSENVAVTGSPRIRLTVGTATQYATYASGSGTNTIIFKYTIPINMLDTDGIAALNNVDLNGGTIKDLASNAQTNFAFTVPLLTGVRVDSMAPLITSFTPPLNQNYTTGVNMNFTVVFSQVVVVIGSPSLTLVVGADTKNAVYVSGSGTTSLVFRYTVALNDNDPNGIDRVSPLLLNSGSIKDTQGNNANLTFVNGTHAGLRVDALAPSLLSITPPADNIYKSGGIRPVVSFNVFYNEPITVVGAPRIHLTVGSILRYATYASGSGTANLVFNYNVDANDFDLDGISIGNLNAIDLNGGTLRDAVNFNAPLNFGTVNSSGIHAVYSIMENWYDISDTSKLVFNGFNVFEIQDKVNAYNLTHTGTGAIYNSTNFNGGSQSFVTCNSGNSFDGVKNNSPQAIVAIYRAPMNTTNQYIYYLTSNTRPMVRFTSTANGGTVAFGVNGRKYSGGVWSTAAATATNLWAPGQVTVSGFAWGTSQNRINSLCKMDGELAEAFFFNTLPTSAQMTTLQTYINNRYGLVFP